MYAAGSGGTTFDWDNPIVGDFNGDGRDDVATLLDSDGSQQLVVATSIGHRLDPPKALADLGTAGKYAAEETTVGDFNGDGRDDLWLSEAGAGDEVTRELYLSDGSNFFHQGTTTTDRWINTSVGDFDGDGADELVGRESRFSQAGKSTDWRLLDFEETTGSVTHQNWGTSLLNQVNDDWTVTVGDANRDGRDDLIGKHASSAWFVSLSQGISFQAPPSGAELN